MVFSGRVLQSLSGFPQEIVIQQKSRKERSIRSASKGRVHGDAQGNRQTSFKQVHDVVRRIPRARVMTYGQIATEIENRLSARAVGWALHGCPADLPWHRVVNASGGCSTDRLPDNPAGFQRALLEEEGVEFRKNGTLDLSRYRWDALTSRSDQ